MRGRESIRSLAIGLTTLLLAGGGAAAQDAVPTGTPSDLDRVINVLQDMGYRAARDDTTTTPSILSKFSGVNSRVEVLRCDEGTAKNCGMLRFHAGFDLEKGLDLKMVNDWNYNKYFGRAYLDPEDDPHVDLVVSMVGASDDNLTDLVEWWETVVSDFKGHIGW